MNPIRTALRLPLAALIAAAVLAAVGPAPARAQALVAVVNGDPITAVDIAQRQRLHQLSGRANVTRQQVLEELIDQRLKLQVARRSNITIENSDVDRAFASMAQRSGRTVAQFEQALSQGQISVATMKARIRSDLAWQQYLQQNAGSVMIRDADIVALMQARGQNLQIRAVQYTMQQVIFVVRRTASPEARQARVRAAEALRARVSSCDEAVSLSRGIPEVVVKQKVRRISTDLTPTLQKLLESTPDGRMTPPEPTPNGIEVVAICERREIAADISANKDVRNELLNQRLQAYEKRVLDDMRGKSIIRIVAQP
jgi:peptidyl-prolyl cis-trans isomerase SurA